jgi:hypothetical protein
MLAAAQYDAKLFGAVLSVEGWSAKAAACRTAVGEAAGGVVCYGEDGCMIANVTDPPGAGAGDAVKLKDGVAGRIAVMSCGVEGSVSVFVIKSAGYIPLMEQILRKTAGGREVLVRRIAADSGQTLAYRIPPLPEPVWRAVLAKVADGGIATGFAAFCTLLGCLITRLLGFAVAGQAICLAALAAVVGLMFGMAAQWAGRHWAGLVHQQVLT